MRDYLNDLFTIQQLRPDSIKLWPTRMMTICHDVVVLPCPFVLVILGAKFTAAGPSSSTDKQLILGRSFRFLHSGGYIDLLDQ